MLTYLSYQQLPRPYPLALPTFNPDPQKKLRWNTEEMRLLTAKTVRISPQLMGGMELEAQIGSHAFDGKLGASYGVDHGERAVDHVAGGKDARHGGHTVLIDRKQATMVGL